MTFTAPTAEYILAIVFFIVLLMYVSIMYIKDIITFISNLMR